MSKELYAALEQLYKAWTVTGPAPEVHLVAQRRLHREWPTLAGAVATFTVAFEKEMTS